MGRDYSLTLRISGLALVATAALALGGCKPSPEAQLRAQVAAIREEASAATQGKVKVNAAWVGGSGDLCGTFDVERFGASQLGRFAGFPGKAVIETEQGTGFGPDWSQRCGDKLVNII